MELVYTNDLTFVLSKETYYFKVELCSSRDLDL